MAPAVDKATTADLDGIVNVFMDAFSDDFFLELFPRENGVCKDWKSKAWSRFLQWREAGIQEAQVYVVKNDEGIVQAVMLLWIVKAEDGGLHPWTRHYPEVDPRMDKEKVYAFFDGMDKQHFSVMQHQPHIYLEIIMTHSSAQRRGYASALLQKANEIADERDDLLYLDSEKTAVPLYEKAGYVRQVHVERTSPMYPMIRPRRSERLG